MADEEKQEELHPLRNVPTVAAAADPHADKPHTAAGEPILRDVYGRAYTESSPHTGGIRTYLDEAEYPPEASTEEPPAAVAPQAAAAAGEQTVQTSATAAAEEKKASEPAAQEPIAPVAGSAAAAGVESFSATQAAPAEPSVVVHHGPPPADVNAAASAAVTQPPLVVNPLAGAKATAAGDAAQSVIDATLAHPAAQPKASQP